MNNGRWFEHEDPAMRARQIVIDVAIWIALAVAALYATKPHAADLFVTLPGASYHADRSQHWNEFNPGIGVERDGWVSGYYRNSYHRNTWYVGHVWRPLELGNYVRAGVIVSAATGYRWPVVAMPTVNVGTRDVSVDIVAAPAAGKTTSGFVAAQLRVRVW